MWPSAAQHYQSECMECMGFQQARRARCFQKMTFHVLRLPDRSLDEIENFFKKFSTGLLARLIISKSRGTIFVT